MIATRTYRRIWRYAAITALFLCLAQGLQAQTWSWSRQAASAKPDLAYDVAVDSLNGFVYIGGTLEDIPPEYQTLPMLFGQSDAFIAKYDPLGGLSWVLAFGGSGDDEIYAVDVLPGNGVIVAGSFLNSATITGVAGSPSLVLSGNGRTGYVARFDNSGYLVWAKAFYGPSINFVNSLWVQDSYVFVAGAYQDSVGLGAHTTTGTAGLDGFLAKMDTSGNTHWLCSARSNGNDAWNGVTFDGTYVYTVGDYQSDSLHLYTPAGQSCGKLYNPYPAAKAIMYAAYDLNGYCQWIRTIYSTGSDEGLSVAADGNYLYLCGGTGPNPIFPSASSNPTGQSVLDIFFSKHDRNTGATIWAKSETGSNSLQSRAHSIATDGYGNLVIGGEFRGTVNFSGTPLVTQGNADAWLASYSSNMGNLNWILTGGGQAPDIGHAVAVDRGLDFFLAGEFRATAYFQPDTLFAPGVQNIFVAKYGCQYMHPDNFVLSIPNDSICIGDPLVLSLDSSLSGVEYQLFDAGGSAALSPKLPGNGGTLTFPAIFPQQSGSWLVQTTETSTGCRFPLDTILDFTVVPLPQPDLGPDTTVCAGDILTLDPGNFSGQSIWSTGSVQPTINVNLNGLYGVVWTSSLGCAGSDIIQVSFRQGPTPNFSDNEVEICAGETVELKPDLPSGFSQLDFLWNTGATQASILADASGTYWLQLTDSMGCTGADSVVLTVRPELVAVIGGLGSDVCESDGPQFLSLSPPGGDLYGPGTDNGFFDPTAAGPGGPYTISYAYSDSFGCTDTTMTTVTVHPEVPPANAGPDITVQGSSTVNLGADPAPAGFTGAWVPAAGFNFDRNDPKATINLDGVPAGTYPFVWVISGGYCPETRDTLFLIVPELVIPTGFSPNGDGVNDLYVISGIENYSPRHLTVYSRWGLKLYENAQYDNSWDGRGPGGAPLPDDTYFITLQIGESEPYKGFVIIRR